MKKIKAILASILFSGVLFPATLNPAAASGQICLSPSAPEMGPGLPNSGPPDYYDPIMATDNDLACWGFPPRPSDPTSLATWTYLMRFAKPKHWVHGHIAELPYSLPNPLIRSASQDLHPTVIDTAPNYNTSDAGYTAMFNSTYQVALGQWVQQSYGQKDGHVIAD